MKENVTSVEGQTQRRLLKLEYWVPAANHGMEIIGALIVLGAAAVVVAAHNHTEKKPALDRFAFFSFFLICTLLWTTFLA
jgi:hypothetical protein